VDGPPFRRRGKELRERVLATLLLIPTAPLFLACALLIKLEGLVRPDARGPVFFTETRISRGEPFGLLKFRTLRASALATLKADEPTHIALLEQSGGLTWAGKLIRQWYLDELPQLLNIVRGDMFLIGTRPWPLKLYEADLATGRTLKRDMPAGLIGPVQAHKGRKIDPRVLDADYWEAFRTYPAWRLLLLDVKVIGQSLRVQLEHRGI
jgi:lipopolysaccharide/colanic/teichoic acid biosynthesis glycosyltransferase